MKALKNSVFVFILFMILANCSGNEKAEQSSTSENAISFEKVGEKTFEIDDQSDWHIVLPQTIVIDDKLHLLSLEYKTNVILVFDYSTGKMVKRIPFYKEGPNSIKGTMSSFQAFSEDLLLLTNRDLYITDFSGEIKKRIDLKNADFPGAPRMRPNSIPAVLNGESIVFENYHLANKGRLMKLSVDLENDSVNYFQEIPEAHIEGYWAVGRFGDFTSTINTKTNEFVYNFPGLDSLYIWNSDFTELKKEYAGTSLFEHPIPAIFTMGIMPTEKEIEEKPLTRGIYGHIFYDDTKDLYYRLIGLPISQSLLDSGDEIKSKTRKYAVMVLNSDFEILGEFELPEYEYIIDTEMTFLANGAIHFQKESINEDEAIFDLWSVVQ